MTRFFLIPAIFKDPLLAYSCYIWHRGPNTAIRWISGVNQRALNFVASILTLSGRRYVHWLCVARSSCDSWIFVCACIARVYRTVSYRALAARSLLVQCALVGRCNTMTTPLKVDLAPLLACLLPFSRSIQAVVARMGCALQTFVNHKCIKFCVVLLSL